MFAGCLRNAAAVAGAALAVGGPIGVIAAGERWGGTLGSTGTGPLRPSLEDQLGAGAIIAELRGRTLSPEAEMVAAACRAADVERMIITCGSGRELIAGGHRGDVDLAARVGVSDLAPRLRDGVLSAP